MADTYTVGADKVDITPPMSVPYLGYHPHRLAFFEGIHDRLYARSLYISDGTAEVMIIGLDSIGFSEDVLGKGRNFISEVKGRIHQRTGIAVERIMLSSTHAHATAETLDIRPVIEFAPSAKDWLEELIERIADSALSARQHSFGAQLRIARSEVEGISVNRRNDTCLDNELIVLIFESTSGKKVFLVNFACHAVIVQVQPKVSAGFPGVLQNTIETGIPDVKLCLFLQGACGDINPAAGSSRSFDDVERTGLALAGEVIRLFGISGLTGTGPSRVSIRAVSERIALPSGPLPSKEEIEQAKKELPILEQNVFPIGDCRLPIGNRKLKIENRKSNLSELLARVRQGPGPFSGELQVIQIGQVVLFAIPCEPFCQTGKELKRIAAPFIGLVVGYANGYLGYLAPRQAWEKGGYEVRCGPWSKLGPEACPQIIESFKKMRERF